MMLDDNAIRRIVGGIENSVKDLTGFFGAVATDVHQRTQLMFRTGGNIPGRDPWRPLSEGTKKTTVGTWRIRYGTDLAGLGKTKLSALRAKWGYGHIGEMREGVRRYGADSTPLLASGGFMRSFGVLGYDNRSMKYGTAWKSSKASAADIIGDREVLEFTDADVEKIKTDLKVVIERQINI